ncbi:MAG: helix-turn-helix domain-containing protein [Geminicoccaceae bacterium]
MARAYQVPEERMTSKDPNATAAESAVRQIGTEFRRLRALRGERIEDIAIYLDVKSTQLFGIEQGDLSVIPGKRTAKLMVKSYANYLGLNGESIIGPMDSIIASLDGDKAPSEPRKSRRIDRTSATILVSAVVLGVLTGLSWMGDVSQFGLIAPPVTASTADSDDQDIEAKASAAESGRLEERAQSEEGGQPREGRLIADGTPDGLSGEAAEAAEALLAELKTALTEDTQTAAGNASESVQAVDQVQAKKVERPANVLAALVAERGDGAHIYEAENTDARVIVRALTDVSVQVTSRSRDYVWTRTMRAGEMLLVPNRDDLELWTGNAAGIEVLLDGVVLPPLGPPSTVVSGLSLAVSSLATILGGLPEGSAKPTF